MRATRLNLVLTAATLAMAALITTAQPEGDEITSVDFDTIPAGVSLVSPVIGLSGDVEVSGDLTVQGAGIRFADGTLQTTAADTSETLIEIDPIDFDPIASGQALRDVVASILDASASRRYVILLAPGVYDIRGASGNSLRMKPWVSIEGAGETSTEIRSGGFDTNFEGTVITAGNAELRRLTVSNTGGDLVAVAVLVGPGVTSIDHVRAIATGGSQLNYGLRQVGFGTIVRLFDVEAEASGGDSAYGTSIRDISRASLVRLRTKASGAPVAVGLFLFRDSGALMMEVVFDNVTATADGTTTASAVRMQGSISAVIRRSDLRASGAGQNYGIEATDSDSIARLIIEDSNVVGSGASSDGISSDGLSEVRVDHSRIAGETRSLSNTASLLFNVGASRLSGGPVTGSMRCAFSYDETYSPLADDCSQL